MLNISIIIIISYVVASLLDLVDTVGGRRVQLLQGLLHLGGLDDLVGLLPDPESNVLTPLQAVLYQRVDVLHNSVSGVEVLHGVVNHRDVVNLPDELGVDSLPAGAPATTLLRLLERWAR